MQDESAPNWSDVDFMIRFAMLAAGIKEETLSVTILQELSAFCNEAPADLKGCERLLKERVSASFYVPKPTLGKVLKLQAELSSAGEWSYSLSKDGDTVAHSELGSTNLLKVALPDVPREANARCVPLQTSRAGPNSL
jgi:hypothetical protein